MAKTPNKSKRSREIRQSEKSEALFVVYHSLGEDRSLAKLHAICLAAGLRVGAKTLQNYSAKFHWQNKLLDMNRRIAERRELDQIETVNEMNNRHIQFAKGMQGIAYAGIKGFTNQITADKGGILDLSVSEIVALFKASQSGERLARGEATSRVEIWTDVVETVVHEFSLIFVAVNEITEKGERQREFVTRADEMIRRYYNTIARKQVADQESYTTGE